MAKTPNTKYYRYSYSGSDTRAHAWYPQTPGDVRVLESMHTMSISVHEAKGQARALGFKGVKGLARGIRTIAGSIIFTVIEDHPMRPMMESMHDLLGAGHTVPGWSIDSLLGIGTAVETRALGHNNRLCTLLAPMNIVLQYVSEGAKFAEASENSTFSINGAAALLEGVEFVGEGLVTSINDVVSEVTLSFIATDYKPLAGHTFTGGLPSFREADPRQQTLQDRLMQRQNNIKRHQDAVRKG